MICLGRPRSEQIELLLGTARDGCATYPHEGWTRDASPGDPAPSGYRFDHSDIVLGQGRRVYQSACQAPGQWKMFPPAMAELYRRDTPIEVGQAVADLFGHHGCWTANPARIVYTIEESGDPARFGFGYGNLPGQLVRGEKRFLVEWSQGSNSVVFSIAALSRPNHLMTWVGLPMLRREQHRFRQLAGQSMRDAVSEDRAA